MSLESLTLYISFPSLLFGDTFKEKAESLKVTVLLAVKPSFWIISPAAFVIVRVPSALELAKSDNTSPSLHNYCCLSLL